MKSTFTLPGLPPTSNATPPRALSQPYRAETGARPKRARRERSLIEGDNVVSRVACRTIEQWAAVLPTRGAHGRPPYDLAACQKSGAATTRPRHGTTMHR